MALIVKSVVPTDIGVQENVPLAGLPDEVVNSPSAGSFNIVSETVSLVSGSLAATSNVIVEPRVTVYTVPSAGVGSLKTGARLVDP